MRTGSIFDQDKYTVPVNCILSTFIREYDISKANINILLYKGLISQEQYEYFYNLPKKDREIQIGCMQRDNQVINQQLKEGFKEMRHLFYAANKITEDQILAVKKDAIFLINKTAEITKFRNVEFKMKNEYTSFFKINRVEYLYYKGIHDEKLDTKGLGEYAEAAHKDYMLDFFMYIFEELQKGEFKDAVFDIIGFSNRMIEHELPFPFYRELNPKSMYKTICKTYTRSSDSGMGDYCYYYLPELPREATIYPELIDCSFNLGILRDLYRISINQCFRKGLNNI